MTEQAFIVRVPINNEWQHMLCDEDVRPIREQVAWVCCGGEAPLEWLCLPNLEQVQPVYQALCAAVAEKLAFEREHRIPPLGLQRKVHRGRWRLISLITEAYFGDLKYRAAKLWRCSLKDLRRLAKARHVRGYSRMPRRELISVLARD